MLYIIPFAGTHLSLFASNTGWNLAKLDSGPDTWSTKQKKLTHKNTGNVIRKKLILDICFDVVFSHIFVRHFAVLMERTQSRDLFFIRNE